MQTETEYHRGPFRVGLCEVDPARNRIIYRGDATPLEPRVMDVLCALADSGGEVVSRDALIDRVWKIEHGADESLSRAISQLRKAFKLTGCCDELIETIPKRGYRLIPDVSFDVEEDVPAGLVKRKDAAPPPAEPARVIPGWQVQLRKHWRVVMTGAVALIIVVAGLILTADPGRQRAPARAVPERSVAVLPFVSISSDIEDGYFADGLSEELLNTLSDIPDLKVPGRTATFAFKGKTPKFKEIGEVLGVAHVLEGSVRRSGDRIRISAQLISVDDGYNLWSESYDRHADDLLLVQDDIARRVASALNSHLPAGDAPLFDAGTQNPVAFSEYVKARQYLNNRGWGVAKAISGFEAAIEADPEYARAYAGLAVAHTVSHTYLKSPKEIAWKRGETYARKATDLDPDLAEPFAVLGGIALDQNRWEDALDHFEHAEALDPKDTTAFLWHAQTLMELGYLEKAGETIAGGLVIDSGSAIMNLVAGYIARMRGNLDTADAHFETAINAGMSYAVFDRGLIAFAHNDLPRAADLMAEAAVLQETIAVEDKPALVAYYLTIMRHEASVDAAATAFPTLASDDDFLTPSYLLAGESSNALRMIALDPDGDKDTFGKLWSDIDPGLRQDPYMKTLVEETGVLAYWRVHGWPDKCHAAGDTGFACD
ncbi:winged helix-turn-helix domain-containing protein [Hyphomonas oceanitis]|uniref:Transcriptional regulator domain-containing protein n=1 Tax=Hyphomonas oceanitis SCH89 TaxID=1280953 RepID=A0A059G999_9PROT|nr:winged helix-turn-helix domain-containing protein [Hyphomonas oceanitis]KDA03170.1 transcriptional regulator domain-containing protein [Hyphomonas oceanitis SCH89]